MFESIIKTPDYIILDNQDLKDKVNVFLKIKQHI